MVWLMLNIRTKYGPMPVSKERYSWRQVLAEVVLQELVVSPIISTRVSMKEVTTSMMVPA